MFVLIFRKIEKMAINDFCIQDQNKDTEKYDLYYNELYNIKEPISTIT